MAHHCGSGLWRLYYDGLYPLHLHFWLQFFRSQQLTVLPHGKLAGMSASQVLSALADAFALPLDPRLVGLVGE